MRTHYSVYLLSCILLIALLGGCAKKEPSSEAEQNTAADAPSDSEDAASGSGGAALADSVTFEARTLDGSSVSADLFSESRITMVNVWATYCNPCLREMPGLGELASAYDSGDFQLIGIISDVTEDADENALQKASDLVAQTGAGYPHLLLNESLYTTLLTEVTAVPTTFFVNQDGQILDTVIGAMEKSDWEERIDAFLEE